MLKFWEYQINFKDPASVYAYNLFSIHHDIVWFLMVMLFLVYWCLYKLMSDYNWSVFNNQKGLVLLVLNKFTKMMEILVLLSYYKFFKFAFEKYYYYCLDLKEMSKLGGINENLSDFVYHIINIYAMIINKLLGNQSMNNIINNTLIDMEGKPLLNDEFYLFDTQGWANCAKDFSDWNFTWAEVQYLVNDLFVSSRVYHYTSNSYFFTGYIAIEQFFLRKIKAFSTYYGLLDILKVNNLDYLNLPKTSKKFDEASMMSDSFFESQEFKHSLSFEFMWALFPTAIILCILVPSLYLLYSLDEDLDPKLTIKVMGHQWYWSYEFDNWVNMNLNDENNFKNISYKFDSNIVTTDDLEFGSKRLLEVDKRLVVPVNVTLRFLITAGDVLHAWAMPDLGIKMDAVPGRLNQMLSFMSFPGVYYGQCSELCGISHGFMPIVLHAVDWSVFMSSLDNL